MPTDWQRVVWAAVEAPGSGVHSIEHPVLTVCLPKSEFAAEFAAVLRELDGRSLADYVDFFFGRDVLDAGVLRFRGDDERHDFFDWAVELGCCPPLDVIKSGDDWRVNSDCGKEDLERELQRTRDRDTAARQQAAARQRQRAAAVVPAAEKRRRMVLGRTKALQALQVKVDTTAAPCSKLVAKLEKARQGLAALTVH
jgi:hypothetical protein